MAVKQAICASDNINWLCPINWDEPLNNGLVALYQVFQNQPGWQSSQILSLVDPAYGAHGTLNGPMWQGALGRPGGFGSLFLDATDDYVETNAGAGMIQVGTGDFSWQCWVKLVATGRNDIIVWKNAGGTEDMGLYTDNSTLLTYERGGARAVGATSLAAGVWYHVGLRRVSGTCQVLLNGNVDASGLTDSLDFGTWTNTRLWLGANHGNFVPFSGAFRLNGWLDDVYIGRSIASRYQESKAGNPLTLNRVRPYTVFDMGGAPPGGSILSQMLNNGLFVGSAA